MTPHCAFGLAVAATLAPHSTVTALSSAASSSSTSPSSTSDLVRPDLAKLQTVAADAFATQMSFYDRTRGLFGDPAVNDPFWTSANALANFATYAMLTGERANATDVLANSFKVLVPNYATPERGNDDIQWHAHAWLRAYELTGEASYLTEARNIYNLLLDPASPWHGWNATCGGMNWWSNNPYVNTITNGLAFTGLLRLQRISPSSTPVFGRTLLEWAQLIWQWSQSPGLLSAEGAFLDGFGSDCTTAGGAPWTYNSGIWLDGLTSLTLATGDRKYSDFAFALARSSAKFFSVKGDPASVMLELSCDKVAGRCDGADGREFKGVFARHLSSALRDWAALDGAASNPSAASWARAWIANQTSSILAHNVAAGPGVLFGQLWQGPFEKDNTEWISHSSGFDVILAALAVAQESETALIV